MFRCPKWMALRWQRRSKAIRHLADTRLIVLTSMGHALRSAELKQLGIESYLVKPVKQSRLYAAIIGLENCQTSLQSLMSGPLSRRLTGF
jgi:DNA-binding response OmpR family regulator